MPAVFVSITFDADTPEDAESVIASWNLSPDCSVNSQMTVPLGPNPGATDSDGNVVPAPTAPTLDSLDPPDATAGDPDVTLRCLGTGFTDATVINFNGGDETTVFVSDSELTTIVKTSGAEFEITPGTYPVSVHNDLGASETLMFTIAPEEEAS